MKTRLKLEGKQILLWTIVDVDSKEILVFCISETGCALGYLLVSKKGVAYHAPINQ